MKHKFDGKLLQVIKAVKQKSLLDCHRLFNWGNEYVAFGVHHKPNKSASTKLVTDGEFYLVFKDDETGEIKGYVATIYNVIVKDRRPEQFNKMAKRYSVIYYDHRQYNTIFLVENVQLVNEQTLMYLLNERTYFNDEAKQFNLHRLFKQRTNQVYLMKK